MEGWVKLYRKITEKGFYKKDSEKVHLWVHIIIKATHDGREEMFAGKPIYLNPGQLTTGRKQLSLETGISESKVERALTYFEKIEQQIEQRKSNVNRLITILNWDSYQGIEQRIEQQSNNDRTHYKNDKNVKNKKQCLFSTDYKPLNGYDSLAFILWKQCLDNYISLGVKPTILQKADAIKWANDIKLMIEKDGRTNDEIREVLQFLNTNSFWRKNINSTAKLKLQFETLQVEARSQKTKNKQIFKEPDPIVLKENPIR